MITNEFWELMGHLSVTMFLFDICIVVEWILFGIAVGLYIYAVIKEVIATQKKKRETCKH